VGLFSERTRAATNIGNRAHRHATRFRPARERFGTVLGAVDRTVLARCGWGETSDGGCAVGRRAGAQGHGVGAARGPFGEQTYLCRPTRYRAAPQTVGWALQVERLSEPLAPLPVTRLCLAAYPPRTVHSPVTPPRRPAHRAVRGSRTRGLGAVGDPCAPPTRRPAASHRCLAQAARGMGYHTVWHARPARIPESPAAASEPVRRKRRRSIPRVMIHRAPRKRSAAGKIIECHVPPVVPAVVDDTQLQPLSHESMHVPVHAPQTGCA